MMRTYNMVTRTQGNNRAVKEQLIKPAGFELSFIEFPVLVDAFRLMVREYKFDMCEMAITTYMCAKAHGKKFTAIPVFLVRGFHYGAILVNRKAGIKCIKDLEGKRVGVNRGYTVTTGVWVRAMLQRDYGVDLSKITWVLSGDEHVEKYEAPGNVMPMRHGYSMVEMLETGELAAAIGVDSKHPDVVPLIENAQIKGLHDLRQRGYYPINHLIVIRDDVWQEKPGLAREVFDVFARSKQQYVAALKAGAIATPDAADRLHKSVLEVMPDPLPYGIEPNRAMIEELMENAVIQGIIPHLVDVDGLFIPETRLLAG